MFRWSELNWWGSAYEKNVQEHLYSDDLSKRDWVPDGWNLVYRAFALTPFEDVKVVILGQDPYPNPEFADGLAFSSRSETTPPSLLNIYKELEKDLGVKIFRRSNLEDWARQGVLLLNTRLTTKKFQPGSHDKIGWEYLTREVLHRLITDQSPKVFILWGNDAQKTFKDAVNLTSDNNEHHLVIKSAHPSPLSARKGFFNSKPFSRTNTFLKEKGLKSIDWIGHA